VNTPINLSFRYTESDYARALRAHYATHLRLLTDIASIAVVAAGGAYLWGLPGQHWLGVACVVVAAVFALLLIAAFTIVPKWAFRREPKFLDDYSLTFSPDGIHFRTAHMDSQLKWDMYSRAVIDASSYVLYYGTHHFTVIPRRAFLDEGQRQAFDQMLERHIPRITRRGK
jgi:hypothetical protein